MTDEEMMMMMKTYCIVASSHEKGEEIWRDMSSEVQQLWMQAARQRSRLMHHAIPKVMFIVRQTHNKTETRHDWSGPSAMSIVGICCVCVTCVCVCDRKRRERERERRARLLSWSEWSRNSRSIYLHKTQYTTSTLSTPSTKQDMFSAQRWAGIGTVQTCGGSETQQSFSLLLEE